MADVETVTLDQRPTLRDLAARAGDEAAGLVCPRCHCRDFHVIYTRRQENSVMRRRECRHCGRRVTTREKVIG
jgi:hypothetical protein